MGSSLTKNELAVLSTEDVADMLLKLEGGMYAKHAKTVRANSVNGMTLVSLLDDQDVDLFLLEMGVQDIRERKDLFRLMQAYAEHDGSMVTLDSDAIGLLPSTIEEEIITLKGKGVNAQKLKSLGYSAIELLEFGSFPLQEVLACGYSDQELQEAGYVTKLSMSSVIDGEEISGVYDGMSKDAKAEGEGTCHYANGDVYEGWWKDGQRSGEGRESRKNGDVYQGSWLWGRKHGKGVHTICPDVGCKKEQRGNEKPLLGSDRSAWVGTYVGDFQLDKRHGKGRFTASAGYVYDGSYRHDQKEGEGMLWYANGDTYEGTFRDDKRHGTGVLKYKAKSAELDGDGWGGTQCVYSGRFLFDKKWGRGQVTSEEGEATVLIFDGEFKCDVMHGHGRMCYLNGDVYEGSFVRGVKSGRGEYVWADGDRYEGCFANGKRHDDHGKLTLVEGSSFEGMFRSNHMILPPR